MKNFIRNMLIIICLMIFLFSGYKTATILLEYKKAENQYEEVIDKVVKVVEIEEETEEIKPPIEVDFEALRAENEDIVGWIYIESLDISYPILKAEDNNYYLRRNYKHEYISSGSIFMECSNTPDFSDANTIIYGHNMYDGSMFGMLKHILKEEHYKNNPVVWILTPEESYCYQVFTAYTTSPVSDTFTVYKEHSEAYFEYQNKMKDQTQTPFEADASGEQKMITLSTCTDNGSKRFIVQAVLMSETGLPF